MDDNKYLFEELVLFYTVGSSPRWRVHCNLPKYVLSQLKRNFYTTWENRIRQHCYGHALASAGTLNRMELGEPETASRDRHKRMVGDPEAFDGLLEGLYCARGEMENRIKEQQRDLFADRTSAHTMRANQLRLYFSSFAYVLMHALR